MCSVIVIFSSLADDRTVTWTPGLQSKLENAVDCAAGMHALRAVSPYVVHATAYFLHSRIQLHDDASALKCPAVARAPQHEGCPAQVSAALLQHVGASSTAAGISTSAGAPPDVLNLASYKQK